VLEAALDMTVLITGVTGFAGRHLGALCAGRQGVSVIGIGRRPLAETDPPAGLDGYERVDLHDLDRIRDVVRSAAPDRVFHLAGHSSVASSWDDPAALIADNVSCTLNLLEAVRLDAPEARVLVAGSSEEYGDPQRLPVTEDHPLQPRNPYGISKAAIDLAAGVYTDAYGLHVVRTRAFNHIGPGQSDSFVTASFARQIADAERAGEGTGAVEVLTGNVHVKRDFTDVRDVVNAYWLALDGARPGAYNVCSGRVVPITDILGALAGHTRLDVTFRPDPAAVRKQDVREIYGSHQKLTGATGWEPRIPLEQTIGDTLDWWRERMRSGVAS
jgi:GDP-4-dehydro-6-deoxy-D-mannose reductase